MDIDKITLAEAQIGLNVQDSDRRGFLAAAFRSKRLELLRLCFETPDMWGEFIDAMKAMPESSYKHQLLISVLTNQSVSVWDRNPVDAHIPFVTEYGRNSKAAAIIPMLHPLLPDVPIIYQVISTPEKRLAHATRYAKAAGIPLEDPSNALRVWPPKAAGASKEAKQAADAAERVPAAAVAVTIRPEASGPLPGGWLPWAGIAAAITAAAGWLLLRAKRKKV